MADPELLARMRADWNDRAREDARYYAAFGRRGQQDDEFFASAADVVRSLEEELKRLPHDTPAEARRGLEIGCGPGRLVRPMSRDFGEIHGVDVSDEMIRLAQERFHGASGMKLHVTSGADLAPLAAAYFDFVYSYAVFQHIPSRDVVLAYFDEIRRVLKSGGIARLHLNGLPPDGKAPDTWDGVRFSREEAADYARGHDLQLLALEGAGTESMWITWRKQPAGWRAGLKNQGAPAKGAETQIHRTGCTNTGEPVVAASGRFAGVSFWMERLPADCDLNDLSVTFDGAAATPFYIGPPKWDAVQQLNVRLPPGVRTGIIAVELLWLGKPLCPRASLRVMPPGPPVPRICSVSDGTNPPAGVRLESGTVRLIVEDLSDGEPVSASIGGRQLADLTCLPADTWHDRFEVHIRLPADLPRGSYQLELQQGSRRLAPVAIEAA